MAAKPSPTYDEEITYDEGIKIDFGKYIETLARQWQWIVACALGLGILVLAYSLFIKYKFPSYQATAVIASVKTASAVNFGSAITSLSAADLAASYDRQARLHSFVAQVQNGTVAEQVLQEVGLKLKKGEQTTADLLKMVNGSLIPNTDSIQISVTYSDPIIAAEIANAWGKAYVQNINNVYGDSSGGTSVSISTIQAQVAQAKTEYEKAQAALTDFTDQDKTNEYKRQIDDITVILTSMRAAQTTVGDQQVQDPMTRLVKAYSDSRQTRLFLDSAVSMRAAVNIGGEPAAISNALAMTMLKAQIYANLQGAITLQVQNLPETLVSNIPPVNAAGMVADLDALISTLKTRQNELDTLIGTLSSEIKNGDNLNILDENANSMIEKKIEENEQKLRDLNSLISAETSKQDELTRARDLTWQTYSSLATKGAEMSVAAQTTGSEVAFALPATPPDQQSIHSVNNAASATGLGFLLGVVVAYAYELWQNYKGRQTEIISKKMFAYAKDLVHKKPIKSRNELK